MEKVKLKSPIVVKEFVYIYLKLIMKTFLGFRAGFLFFTPVYFLFFVLVMISTSWPSIGSASPHPGMASSSLSSLKTGVFFKPHGFLLSIDDGQWLLGEASIPGDKNSVRSWQLTAPNNYQDQTYKVNLALDSLKSDLSLEQFAKKSLKEYSPLGFSLLGSKSFQQNGQRGIVVDLIHSQKNQQLRQAIYLSGRKVFIFTCSGERAYFKNNLDKCNSLIKGFTWDSTYQSLHGAKDGAAF